MKKLVSILCSVGLIIGTIVPFLSPTVQAQGSAPSTPSPFKWNGNYIENVVKTTTGLRIIVTNSNGKDTINLYRVGNGYAYLSATNLRVDAREVNADSVKINSGGSLVLNNSRVKGFLGSRLQLDPSNYLAVTFGASPLTASEMQNQTITKFQMDTTQAFVAPAWYNKTSAVSDSAAASLYTAKYAIGNKRMSAMSPTDQYVMTYDLAKDSVIWKASPAAAGGTTTKIDTSGSHSTNKVMSASSYVVAFPGATFTKYGASNDTLAVTFGGGSIKNVGDTLSGTHSWAYGGSGSLSGIDTVRAKKFIGSDSVATPNLFADVIKGRTNTDLSIYAYSSQKYINLKSDTISTGYSTPHWYIYGDTIYDNSTGATLWTRRLIGDSVRIGGTWFSNVNFTDATHGNTAIATRKQVRDTINAALTAYVPITSENWQKTGTGPYTWTLSNGYTGDVPATIVRQSGSTYSTTLSAPTGNLALTAPTAGTKVTIQGPTTGNPVISMGANVATNNFSIDSVARIDADTLHADVGVRIQTNPALVTNYTFIKSGATTPYTITLPTTLGSGGYMYFDASGVGSFSSGAGGGGGGNPIYINATKLDSIQIISGIGTTPAIVHSGASNGLDSIQINVGSLDSTMLASGSTSNIATYKRVADSLSAFRTTRQPFGTGAFTVTPADSIFSYSATRNTKMLSIKGSFSGGDTVTIAPYTGYGMNIGGTGVTYLGGDSTILSQNKGKLVFGLNSSSSTRNWLDSLRVDSLTRGLKINLDSAYAIAPTTILGKGAITTGDSTWLTLGREDAGQTYLFVDSTSDAGTVPIRDSCAAQFIMPCAFQLDSFKFMYKVANTADSIGNVLLYGPKTGNMYADSIYMTNTNQQLHSTSLAEKSYAKSATFRAGQEVKVRFTTYLSAQSRYAKVVYVTLWGRKRS